MAGKVVDLELTARVDSIRGTENYDYVHALVRYRGRPVGWLAVANEGRRAVVSAERIRETIAARMAGSLARAVLADELDRLAGAELARLPPVSVIICTRNRADQLAGCVEAVLALDYPCYEVIVVDNAPESDDTARLVAGLAVRYVCERRPGLDWARNRGIAEARHEIVAFTDDDARPDRRWLRAIGRAFGEPDVMCVTGLVAPAELETDAQEQFEFSYGGMGKGFRRRIVRPGTCSPRQLLWANGFGVGANMAFRRRVFERLGPFDIALDAGTPAGGGGDLDMFHRLVAGGEVLSYEPGALVWHRHRRSERQLRRQLFDNGRSFGAYLLSCRRHGTVTGLTVVGFAIWQWWSRWLLARLLRPRGLPRRFILCEMAGALWSPLAYRAAQARARQTAAS